MTGSPLQDGPDAPRWPARAPGALFVTVEGIDGVGKSTQAARAAAALRNAGRMVVETREPGGAPGAEAIRDLLVTGEPGRWSGETELLLFTAARRDHVERRIAPALADGAVVICDRFVDSTRAYQAAGRGADAARLEALHRLAIGLEPDLTLIYDMPPEAAAARRAATRPAGVEDRFERFEPAFHTRLRDAFRAIAAAHPARCRLIDANRDADAVAADTLAALRAALTEGAGAGAGAS